MSQEPIRLTADTIAAVLKQEWHFRYNSPLMAEHLFSLGLKTRTFFDTSNEPARYEEYLTYEDIGRLQHTVGDLAEGRVKSENSEGSEHTFAYAILLNRAIVSLYDAAGSINRNDAINGRHAGINAAHAELKDLKETENYKEFVRRFDQNADAYPILVKRSHLPFDAAQKPQKTADPAASSVQKASADFTP